MCHECTSLCTYTLELEASLDSFLDLEYFVQNGKIYCNSTRSSLILIHSVVFPLK